MADLIQKTASIEEIAEINTLVLDRTIVSTINSTIVMTNTSTSQQIFTGSTAGLVMQLPNATTLRSGLFYLFWNRSTVDVTVKLNDTSTTLVTINPNKKVTIVLQDNSTTNGTWIYNQDNTGVYDSSMPMHFGESGSVGNTYLFECTTSKISSDQLSPTFPRKTTIVGYSFTCLNYIATKTIKIRSAGNLGVDKMTITLSGSPTVGWNNSGYTTFNAGERPAVYLENTSGGSLSTPRFTLYYVFTD